MPFGIRQRTSAYCGGKRMPFSIRQHTSAYVSIRQHTSAYARHVVWGQADAIQRTSAYVSIRQHTSAFGRRGWRDSEQRGWRERRYSRRAERRRARTSESWAGSRFTCLPSKYVARKGGDLSAGARGPQNLQLVLSLLALLVQQYKYWHLRCKSTNTDTGAKVQILTPENTDTLPVYMCVYRTYCISRCTHCIG
jgi:hypothetical protein